MLSFIVACRAIACEICLLEVEAAHSQMTGQPQIGQVGIGAYLGLRTTWAIIDLV